MKLEDIVEFDEQPNDKNIKGWDRHFCELLIPIASKSKDPSTKVGAIITYPDHGMCSTGFNGFPRGVDDSEERLNDRPTKYSLTVHAEANAILNAVRHGHKTEGCKMYLPWYSCSKCALLVVQSGIKTVVLDKEYVMAEDLVKRWKDEIRLAFQIYKESNVKVYRG